MRRGIVTPRSGHRSSMSSDVLRPDQAWMPRMQQPPWMTKSSRGGESASGERTACAEPRSADMRELQVRVVMSLVELKGRDIRRADRVFEMLARRVTGGAMGFCGVHAQKRSASAYASDDARHSHDRLEP